MKTLSAAAIVSLGLAALVPAAATAADIAQPVYKAAPVAAAYDWNGFYAGGHVGYGWGRFDHSLAGLGPDWAGPLPAFLNTHLSPDLKDGSLLGGLSLGANLRQGRVVWGLEADISWTGLKDSQQSSAPNPNNATVLHIFSSETKVDWLATLRARVGWLLNDQTLPYVTGGLAIGGVRSSSTMIERCNGCGIPFADIVFAGSSSTTSVGWSLGGGFEYAFAPRWTLKAEYLHVDLGKESFRNTEPANPNLWQDISVKTTIDLVRVGANYRF
jgi:outer membrane immunogenic protein